VPDIQGSVIASLDASSGVLTKAGYRPYGESNTATGVFRYTGARIDSETNGLYNFRARMYSPVLGRFMQVDPIGTRGGVNLYAYVGNDPLNLLDPYGLSPDSPLSKAATSFYNNLLAQPVKDISDLINNPSQIANAIASVAPRLGPIAELPQALSGAIGTAKGLSSLVSAAGNGSPAPTEYNYTNTVENNAASRPYINSPLTIQEITSTGAGASDPGGIPGALRYDVPGTVSRPGATVGAPNATITGTYELVIDPKTNTVYHFLFKSGPWDALSSYKSRSPDTE
jgi:RHS repeat-associated protein